MGYATFDDVQARLGRFQGVFEITGKHPDQTDIEALLDEVAADIDAALRSRGFDPAGLNASTKAALLDLNAYGVLARALPSTNLGPQAADLLTVARSVWELAMGASGSIASGTHPAVAELEAGAGGEVGPSAGEFWADEPTYASTLASRVLASTGQALDVDALEPQFRRGQTL